MNTGHTNKPLRSRAPSPRVISLPCDAESVTSDGTRAFKKSLLYRERGEGQRPAGRFGAPALCAHANPPTLTCLPRRAANIRDRNTPHQRSRRMKVWLVSIAEVHSSGDAADSEGKTDVKAVAMVVATVNTAALVLQSVLPLSDRTLHFSLLTTTIIDRR